MAITATAGSVSATIKPNRPSLADMQKYYPPKAVSRKVLYNMKIGGELTDQDEVEYLKNTCSIRMSYALLRSGFALERTTDHDGSKLGHDGKWYWIRVNDLRAELIKRFKGFDAELTFALVPASVGDDGPLLAKARAERKLKAQQFLDTKLAGKSGIVVFKVAGWKSATGHFTMWDGKKKELACAPGHDDPNTSDYYFWLTSTGPFGLDALSQVTNVQFWELK